MGQAWRPTLSPEQARVIGNQIEKAIGALTFTMPNTLRACQPDIAQLLEDAEALLSSARWELLVQQYGSAPTRDDLRNTGEYPNPYTLDRDGEG